MYMITRYDNKIHTVVASEHDTVFAMTCMIEKVGTKYKVTDRLGLVSPSEFGWGDFYFWLTKVEEELN